jgi:hypothetical protein
VATITFDTLKFVQWMLALIVVAEVVPLLGKLFSHVV